jgi:hypothetical protein
MMRGVLSSLSFSDYFRRPLLDGHTARDFWEWVHFAVRTASIDLLVNFCMAVDPRAGCPPGAWVGCWMVAARDRQGWLGDVERFDQEMVTLGKGRIFAELGDNCISLQEGIYRLRGRLRRFPVALDMVLVPAAMPLRARLGGGGLSWFVVPRLSAWGTVQIDGRRHALQGTSAYCDHNWGPIGSADLAWEWGYTHARGGADSETVVFVRLLDKARLATRMQGLFLWRDGRPGLVLRDRRLRIRWSRGVPRRLQTIPGVCSLLLPRMSTEVPAEFSVEGEGASGDRLSFSFRPSDAVRLAIPDGAGDGLIVIHESTGGGALRGQLCGRPFELEGDGFFEFVTR